MRLKTLILSLLACASVAFAEPDPLSVSTSQYHGQGSLENSTILSSLALAYPTAMWYQLPTSVPLKLITQDCHCAENNRTFISTDGQLLAVYQSGAAGWSILVVRVYQLK
jgi:hypothetical protein